MSISANTCNCRTSGNVDNSKGAKYVQYDVNNKMADTTFMSKSPAIPHLSQYTPEGHRIVPQSMQQVL